MYTDTRYDCFLIWPHGLGFLSGILKILEHDTRIEIKLVKRLRVKRFGAFIKEIYSFDYAPWYHLKSKTRYLNSLGDEVCFIFVKNNYPNIETVDVGKHRHNECFTIKEIKNLLREKYNARNDSGQITHNHIVHATDNQHQTLEMLRIANLPENSLFNTSLFGIPWFLLKPTTYRIKEVSVDLLLCRQNSLEGSYVCNVLESVQYKSLLENEISNIYDDYISIHLGNNLIPFYSSKKYSMLRYSMNTTDIKNCNILVEELNGKYIVVDGLHRLCILLKDIGFVKVMVCVIHE